MNNHDRQEETDVKVMDHAENSSFDDGDSIGDTSDVTPPEGIITSNRQQQQLPWKRKDYSNSNKWANASFSSSLLLMGGDNDDDEVGYHSSDHSTITSTPSLEGSVRVSKVVEQTREFISEQWREFERFAASDSFDDHEKNGADNNGDSSSIQSELKRLKALEKSLNWELSEATVAMSGKQTGDFFDRQWRDFERSTTNDDDDNKSVASQLSIQAELERLRGLEESLFELLNQARGILSDSESKKRKERYYSSSSSSSSDSEDDLINLQQQLQSISRENENVATKPQSASLKRPSQRRKRALSFPAETTTTTTKATTDVGRLRPQSTRRQSDRPFTTVVAKGNTRKKKKQYLKSITTSRSSLSKRKEYQASDINDSTPRITNRGEGRNSIIDADTTTPQNDNNSNDDELGDCSLQDATTKMASSPLSSQESPCNNNFHARPLPDHSDPSIPVRHCDPSKTRRSLEALFNNEAPMEDASSKFQARPVPDFSQPSIPVKYRNPIKPRSLDSVKKKEIGDDENSGIAIARSQSPTKEVSPTSKRNHRTVRRDQVSKKVNDDENDDAEKVTAVDNPRTKKTNRRRRRKKKQPESKATTRSTTAKDESRGAPQGDNSTSASPLSPAVAKKDPELSPERGNETGDVDCSQQKHEDPSWPRKNDQASTGVDAQQAVGNGDSDMIMDRTDEEALQTSPNSISITQAESTTPTVTIPTSTTSIPKSDEVSSLRCSTDNTSTSVGLEAAAMTTTTTTDKKRHQKSPPPATRSTSKSESNVSDSALKRGAPEGGGRQQDLGDETASPHQSSDVKRYPIGLVAQARQDLSTQQTSKSSSPRSASLLTKASAEAIIDNEDTNPRSMSKVPTNETWTEHESVMLKSEDTPPSLPSVDQTNLPRVKAAPERYTPVQAQLTVEAQVSAVETVKIDSSSCSNRSQDRAALICKEMVEPNELNLQQASPDMKAQIATELGTTSSQNNNFSEVHNASEPRDETNFPCPRTLHVKASGLPTEKSLLNIGGDPQEVTEGAECSKQGGQTISCETDCEMSRLQGSANNQTALPLPEITTQTSSLGVSDEVGPSDNPAHEDTEESMEAANCAMEREVSPLKDPVSASKDPFDQRSLPVVEIVQEERSLEICNESVSSDHSAQDIEAEEDQEEQRQSPDCETQRKVTLFEDSHGCRPMSSTHAVMDGRSLDACGEVDFNIQPAQCIEELEVPEERKEATECEVYHAVPPVKRSVDQTTLPPVEATMQDSSLHVGDKTGSLDRSIQICEDKQDPAARIATADCETQNELSGLEELDKQPALTRVEVTPEYRSEEISSEDGSSDHPATEPSGDSEEQTQNPDCETQREVSQLEASVDQASLAHAVVNVEDNALEVCGEVCSLIQPAQDIEDAKDSKLRIEAAEFETDSAVQPPKRSANQTALPHFECSVKERSPHGGDENSASDHSMQVVEDLQDPAERIETADCDTASEVPAVEDAAEQPALTSAEVQIDDVDDKNTSSNHPLPLTEKVDAPEERTQSPDCETQREASLAKDWADQTFVFNSEVIRDNSLDVGDEMVSSDHSAPGVEDLEEPEERTETADREINSVVSPSKCLADRKTIHSADITIENRPLDVGGEDVSLNQSVQCIEDMEDPRERIETVNCDTPKEVSTVEDIANQLSLASADVMMEESWRDVGGEQAASDHSAQVSENVADSAERSQAPARKAQGKVFPLGCVADQEAVAQISPENKALDIGHKNDASNGPTQVTEKLRDSEELAESAVLDSHRDMSTTEDAADSVQTALPPTVVTPQDSTLNTCSEEETFDQSIKHTDDMKDQEERRLSPNPETQREVSRLDGSGDRVASPRDEVTKDDGLPDMCGEEFSLDQSMRSIEDSEDAEDRRGAADRARNTAEVTSENPAEQTDGPRADVMPEGSSLDICGEDSSSDRSMQVTEDPTCSKLQIESSVCETQNEVPLTDDSACLSTTLAGGENPREDDLPDVGDEQRASGPSIQDIEDSDHTANQIVTGDCETQKATPVSEGSNAPVSLRSNLDSTFELPKIHELERSEILDVSEEAVSSCDSKVAGGELKYSEGRVNVSDCAAQIDPDLSDSIQNDGVDEFSSPISKADDCMPQKIVVSAACTSKNNVSDSIGQETKLALSLQESPVGQTQTKPKLEVTTPKREELKYANPSALGSESDQSPLVRRALGFSDERLGAGVCLRKVDGISVQHSTDRKVLVSKEGVAAKKSLPLQESHTIPTSVKLEASSSQSNEDMSRFPPKRRKSYLEALQSLRLEPRVLRFEEDGSAGKVEPCRVASAKPTSFQPEALATARIENFHSSDRVSAPSTTLDCHDQQPRGLSGFSGETRAFAPKRTSHVGRRPSTASKSGRVDHDSKSGSVASPDHSSMPSPPPEGVSDCHSAIKVIPDLPAFSPSDSVSECSDLKVSGGRKQPCDKSETIKSLEQDQNHESPQPSVEILQSNMATGTAGVPFLTSPATKVPPGTPATISSFSISVDVDHQVPLEDHTNFHKSDCTEYAALCRDADAQERSLIPDLIEGYETESQKATAPAAKAFPTTGELKSLSETRAKSRQIGSRREIEQSYQRVSWIYTFLRTLSTLLFGKTVYKVTGFGSSSSRDATFSRSYQGTVCVFLALIRAVCRISPYSSPIHHHDLYALLTLLLLPGLFTWLEIKTPHSFDEVKIALIVSIGVTALF